MRCSVVIPCHNGVALTRSCIESLLAQTERPHEILIVDNGSSDETGALGEQFGAPVRVLEQRANLGFAGGVNAGLRAATGELLLVLNNDTQAATNLIRELRRVLDLSPAIGAVAPVSNHVKGDAHLLVGGFGRDPAQRAELADELQRSAALVQDADTLAGLCLMMRRSTLDRVGLFDERFGHGNYEDDDLSLRLRLHGYRLAIARRAFLHHEGHATFQALGLDLKQQIDKRLAQFRAKWQHHPAGLAVLAGLHHDLALAAGAADEARRRCPQWLDADWHLGRFHERHGDAVTAITHLRQFLRSCPEHVEARLTLGLAQLRSGQRADGQRTLEQTLSRHRPTHAQEARMLERLGELAYEDGELTAAAAHFGTAVELQPERNELHNWLGLALLGLERVGDARDAFSRACELGHALAHTNLGICQHRLGQLEAAVASFARAVELLPDDPIARANYEAGVAARTAAAC
ncbi:MAG: glycosyltransferase [Planctomycetes bacterium]|nr:glycosyltransferase [Planctomycetota bacterium]